MTEIVQQSLPVAPWMAPHTWRLPGTTPIAAEDWLRRDEVYAEQMALRDRLIAERRAEVYALAEASAPAARELLGLVLAHVARDPGYVVGPEHVRRPDGQAIALGAPPALVAGRLVQEDLLILEKPEGAAEHVLSGGILCFPSNWTLAQKLGHGLARIHLPVERYDDEVARRVQRLFDALRPQTPLMRANLIEYDRADLHNPRREFDRHRPAPGARRFIRVERQVLLRLPETGAVVFSIHTYMVRPESLTQAQRQRLGELRPEALGAERGPDAA